jgi:hypothetical protein
MVMQMWRAGTNELGERLSPLERSALVERYCELFGTWPPEASASHASTAGKTCIVCVPQRVERAST